MRIGQLALRVWAVAVLVLGIVVMHHVAQPSHDTAVDEMSVTQTQAADHGMDPPDGSGAAAAEDDPSSSVHDMLHLCLAVMTAAAVLLAGWVLLVRCRWTEPSLFVAFRAQPMPARPPPRPHGPELLMSLCVMRT